VILLATISVVCSDGWCVLLCKMAQRDYKFTGNTEDFECPICTLVVSSPVQTNCCGSVYCKSCIVQWGGTYTGSGGSQRQHRRRSVKCCPNCRHTPLQYYDDKRTERMVKNLTVTCSNHMSGCEWTGELRNLPDHLNSSSTSGCQYQVVPCPNRCGGTGILRSHLENHIKEECTHRKVQCVYCHLTGFYKVIVGSHYDECPGVTVQCPNSCSTSNLLRSELMEHIKNCPLQVVPCEYSHAGCDKHMARKDIEIHQVTGMVEHLTLVNKKLLQLQEQIECKDHIVPIVFKMSNFSQQKSWAGPCFYSHCNGYKLQLIVTVNRTTTGLFNASNTTTSDLFASSSHSATTGAIRVSSSNDAAPHVTNSSVTASIATSTASSLGGFGLRISTAKKKARGMAKSARTNTATSATNTNATTRGLFANTVTSCTANSTATVQSIGATNTNTAATCTAASSIWFGLMATSMDTSTTSTLHASSSTSRISSTTFDSSNATTTISGSFTTSAGHFGSSSFNSNTATGSLSISVVIKEGPFDAHLQWPMCARVSVKLLNQLQDSQHHSVALQMEKPRPGTTHVSMESDCLHFIFCEMLNTTLCGSPVQFLKDDSLYFQVTVELLGAHHSQPWLNHTLVLT